MLPIAAVENPLALPEPGDHTLRILTPRVLELELITRKDKDPAPAPPWSFVGRDGKGQLPAVSEFKVLVSGKDTAIREIGFKRRPLYAPLKQRDLRLGNWLYLQLAEPIPEGAQVEVTNPSGKLWQASTQFKTAADPLRWSPVIHVNQTGYAPNLTKRASIGHYMGTLGELIVPTVEPFRLIDLTGKEVFSGKLTARRDVGFTFPSYQQVAEADFTQFNTPGIYRIKINGVGVSYPFSIDAGAPMGFARAYALGLYHQRCGCPNEWPHTRHSHAPCHTAPAAIPTRSFDAVQSILKSLAGDPTDARHVAKRLSSIDASLFPFVKQGSIDVSGGHHDAGDYSKYTINSAALIHHLVFAADNFKGAADMDNLGGPESGDGRGDLLQIAKWEADFLAKMQDSDGGFYFLVYPKERRYEDNVTPDKGDPQVVYPKTTTVTAAAVAALAQTASSPTFKKQFPAEAKVYLQKAQAGWDFLQKALAKHGRDGSYQQVTHYGVEFIHDDELAWAATEIYLATGNQQAHQQLLANFDPSNRDTKRWSWWGMFEAYGNTIRSYTFAARSGRVGADKLNAEYLRKCEQEARTTGMDQARWSQESAYGISFPDASKRHRNAGWFFALDRAFDSAVAAALATNNADRAQLVDAVVANMNYEGGMNPVNVSFITGLGYKRPRDIVSQYAQNDRRALPPSGIPVGNIVGGFMFQHHYERELGQLTFPNDGDEQSPYPFYDRWGDSFNTAAEAVIGNQARSLATLAFLVGETGFKQAPSELPQVKIARNKSLAPRIVMPENIRAGETVELRVELAPDLGLDPRPALVVWEGAELQPQLVSLDTPVKFTPTRAGQSWVEVEAHWPDGRRIFASAELNIQPADARTAAAR